MVNDLGADFNSDKRAGKSLKVGAVSGAIEAIVNQPLLTWKTRVQAGLPSPLTFNPRVLYRGVGPNALSMSVIIAMRMSIRDLVQYEVLGVRAPNFFQQSLCAFSAGIGSSIITSTVELGMTQQQRVDPGKKAPFLTAYSSVVKQGLSRAFVGMPLVGLRDGFFSLGFMSLAPNFKAWIRSRYPVNDFQASISGGIPAGLAVAILSHPFDTVKTIQHANALSPNVKDFSSSQIVRRVLKTDGVRGLYGGLFWRSARVASGVTILEAANDKLSRKF